MDGDAFYWIGLSYSYSSLLTYCMSCLSYMKNSILVVSLGLGYAPLQDLKFLSW